MSWFHSRENYFRFLHPNSCECTKSELDLFEVPSTQTSVAYGYWEQKGLTLALTDQGPYEYCQVHVLFDIVFPQTPDILFLLDVCNNRGKLSYRSDELVSF
jgi:hypothetical protein